MKNKTISVMTVFVLCMCISFVQVFAIRDGYAEKTVNGEKLYTIIDMNNSQNIVKAGLAPSRNIYNDAVQSAHWNNHGKNGTVTFSNVLSDWTDFEKIKVSIYSSKKVNTNVAFVVETEPANFPGQLKSYTNNKSYGKSVIYVNWVGWKEIEIDLSDMLLYNQILLDKVKNVKFSASSTYGGAVNSETDLYIDNVYGVIKNDTLTEPYASSVTDEEKEKFEKAADGAVVTFDFFKNAYKDNKIYTIDENIITSEGYTAAPLDFFETVINTRNLYSDGKYTLYLGDTYVTVEEGKNSYTVNGEQYYFKTPPICYNGTFYIPLIECMEAFGYSGRTFDQITVIGKEKNIKAFNDDENLVDIGKRFIAERIVPREEVTSEDWAKVRENWRRYLVGDDSMDISHPYVQKSAKLVNDKAQSKWDTLNKNPDAKRLFGDDVEITKTADMTSQISSIKTLALAYATKGCELYQNEELKNDIIYCLEWFYENLYGQDEINDRGWALMGSYNWWDWSVGVPQDLGNTLIIMYDDLTPDDVKKYMSAYKHHQKRGGSQAGRSYVTPLLAVLIEDYDLMLEGLNEYCYYMFDIQEDGSGFRQDNLYITHAYFPYSGHYGVDSVLNRIGKVQPIVSGTVFDFTSPKKYRPNIWFEETWEPIRFQNRNMAAFGGRYPDSELVDGKIVALAQLEYYGKFGPDEDKIIERMIRRDINDGNIDHFLGYTSPGQANTLAKILDSSQGEQEPYTRAKVYYTGDRVVQQRNGYAFTVSMSSERIGNYESINGVNQNQWYAADGMLYMYLPNDPGHYSGDFWTQQNPYHRQGTTVDTQTRYLMLIDQNPYLSSQDFVGGVELEGEFAAAAMQLESYHNENGDPSKLGESKGTLPYHVSTLMAKKSWFFFDDEAVCLGTDINAQDGYEVQTVVENRRLNKSREPYYTPKEQKTAGVYKIVSATSSGDDGNPVNNAVDGDKNTRWSCENEAWAVFELEEALPIGYVGIAQYNGTDGKQAVFDLETSLDGNVWETVYSGKASGFTDEMEAYDMSGTVAKYVRYKGHARTSSKWNSITEVKIYAPSDSSGNGKITEFETINIANSGDFTGEKIIGSNLITVDGSPLECVNTYKKTFENPKWVHIEDVAGYYFPSGGKLVMNKTDTEPSWLDMWFTHGKNPENETYSYVLLPMKTAEETKEYAENPDIEILSNTALLQAVRENKTGATGIVFWKKGTFENISVSNPMIVMTRECNGEYVVSFCDPTQKLSDAEITVKGKNLSVISRDEKITVTNGSDTVIKADLDSSMGRTLEVRFKIN